MLNHTELFSLAEYEYIKFYKMLIEKNENLIFHFLSKLDKESEGINNSNDRSMSSIKDGLDINFCIKLIFLSLEHDSSINIISLCFIILDNIREKFRQELKQFCKQNRKYIFLLIQKYILFIQAFYKAVKIDLIEILNFMSENEIEAEEITKLNTAGLVPFILTYLNNCEVDSIQILDFISKFVYNNTMTVINLFEKLNFNFDLNAILRNIGDINLNEEKIMKLKLNLFHIFNFLSFKIISLNKNAFHIDDLLLAIKFIPINKRRKNNIREIMNFMFEICNNILSEDLEKQTVIYLLNSLMSLMFYKKSVRSAFIHSTCLFNSKAIEYLPNGNLNEFIHKCINCNLKICLICVHRCHIGHITYPIGYSVHQCDCNHSNNCQALISLELPTHIRKYKYNLGKEMDKSDLRSEKKNYTHSITISDKCSEMGIHMPTTSKNSIYISTDNNTLTIKTDKPICFLTEDIKEKELEFAASDEETLYYFEVEIVMGGLYDQIAIGVTKNENYPGNEFAGYLDNSVGYHGDDGKCFVNSNAFTYGIKFGSTDILGCGVTTNGNVYFTHNGSLLPLLDVKFRGAIYSIISLRGKYCSVKVNHFFNNLDVYSPIFKHNKQKLLKNPSNSFNHSNTICDLIMSNEQFMKNIQECSRRFKNVDEISQMFNRYSMTLHILCKTKKRNIIKFLIISEMKKQINTFLLEVDTIEIQINSEINKHSKIEKKKDFEIEKISLKIPYTHEIKQNNIKQLPFKNDFCKCGNGKCLIV